MEIPRCLCLSLAPVEKGGRCPSCGLYRPPAERRSRSRWVPWIAIGILALGLPAAWWISEKGAKVEFRAASSTYRSRRPEPAEASVDEPAVRRLLGELCRAVEMRRNAVFMNCIDHKRALVEIETKAFPDAVLTKSDEAWAQDGLDEGLSRLFQQLLESRSLAGSMMTWRLKFDLAAGEAEATCGFERLGEKGYVHLRFWLVKDLGNWRVFDLELLDSRSRLSETAVLRPRDFDVATRHEGAQRALVKARLQAASGDREMALRTIREGRVQAKGTEVAADLDLFQAELHAAMGKHDEVVRSCDEALKQRKGMPRALVAKAVALDTLGKAEEAVIAYREALEILEAEPVILFRLALTLEAAGKDAEAMETLATAAKAVGEDASLSMELGWGLSHRGGAAAAAESFVKAGLLGDRGAFPEAAEALRRCRAWDGLERLVDGAPQRRTDGMPLELYRGALLRERKRYDEAEAVFAEGAKKAGKDGLESFLEERAVGFAAAGKAAAAMELVDQMKNRTGESARSQATRSCALLAAGRDADAVAELGRALEADPGLLPFARGETSLAPLRGRPEVEAFLLKARRRLLSVAK